MTSRTDVTPKTAQGETTMEQQRDAWIETARQFSQNADYWRGRAEKAERWSIVAHLRRLLRRA